VKRVVVALILACNLLTWGLGLLLGRTWSPVVTLINILYAAALIALLLTPGKRRNIALLAALIVILLWSFATP